MCHYIFALIIMFKQKYITDFKPDAIRKNQFEHELAWYMRRIMGSPGNQATLYIVAPKYLNRNYVQRAHDQSNNWKVVCTGTHFPFKDIIGIWYELSASWNKLILCRRYKMHQITNRKQQSIMNFLLWRGRGAYQSNARRNFLRI